MHTSGFTASAAKVRLEVILKISSRVQHMLKAKAEDAYTDMNDWLGSRFLKEMERYEIKYDYRVILIKQFKLKQHRPVI